MKKSERKYWLVQNISKGGFPTKKHYSAHNAEAEAQRLAECNYPNRFVVLETVSCFEAQAPIVKHIPLLLKEEL